MVRQAVIEGQAQIVWGGAALAVAIAMFLAAFAGWKAYQEDSHSIGDMAMVFSLILGAGAAGVGLWVILLGWQHVMNPDYYAIRLLMGK